MNLDYSGSGLKRDELCIPLPFTDENSPLEKHHNERIKFDLKAYEHKLYPNCSTCGQKYVPIPKGAVDCFKCNFTKP